MTNEQMERAIEFLLDHHARFSTEMEGLKAAVVALVQSAETDRQQYRERFEHIETQAQADRQQYRERFEHIETQAEADRHEIREAVENLIIANEVTRKLSEDVARLAVQTNHQQTDLDKRVTDLESKRR